MQERRSHAKFVLQLQEFVTSVVALAQLVKADLVKIVPIIAMQEHVLLAHLRRPSVEEIVIYPFKKYSYNF